MFIERLWIIEKVVAAAGMSQPLTKNMDMNSPYLDAHTHTFTHSCSHAAKREKTYGNAQDKTASQFLQAQFYMKNSQLHIYEGDFLRHGKSNKM